MTALQFGFDRSLVINFHANDHLTSRQKSNFKKKIARFSHAVIKYASTKMAPEWRVRDNSAYLNGVDRHIVKLINNKSCFNDPVSRDLYELYLCKDNDDIDREIDIVLRITEQNFASNRFDKVDTALASAITEYISPLAIEGLLRATYRFKHVLPSWDGMLKRAEESLLDAKVDVKIVLAGMR